MRTQEILRSTERKTKKLKISKIKRLGRFCVKFKSVHFDQDFMYPTQKFPAQKSDYLYCKSWDQALSWEFLNGGYRD